MLNGVMLPPFQDCVWEKLSEASASSVMPAPIVLFALTGTPDSPRKGSAEGRPNWYKVAMYFSTSTRDVKMAFSSISTPGGLSRNSVTFLQDGASNTAHTKNE